MIPEYIPLHKEYTNKLLSLATKENKMMYSKKEKKEKKENKMIKIHTWSIVSEIPENKYKNVNAGHGFLKESTNYSS